MAKVLADVFLGGGRNVRLPTTPGRSVQFTGGHCMVVDGRDMPYVLQMDGAKVHPRPDAMPWAPEWLARTDWIKAEVNWPEGWSVEHSSRDEWKLSAPDYDEPMATATPTVSAPVESVDMTDRQPSRGIRIEDLLVEPEPEDQTPPQSRSKKKG